MKKRNILFVFLLLNLALYSQSCFTVRYFGLTVHPFGDKQSQLEPNKIDHKAYFVLNFGGFIGYEKFVWEDFLSIKVMQGVFTDCSGGIAGFSHLGIRGLIFERKKHRILFGIGPTMFYRQDWNRFKDYDDLGFFYRRNIPQVGNVQYKMFWYGIEFEYDYHLNNKIDFNFGFTPGAPMALTFSFGIKYWVSKKFKKNEKFVIPK